MDSKAFNTWYWVAAILGILLVQYVVSMAQQIAPIPYSQFQELLRAGKVAEIGISDRFIQGTLKEPLPRQPDPLRHDPRRPGLRAGTAAIRGPLHGPGREHVAAGHPVVGDPGRALLRGVGLPSRRIAAQGGLGGGLMQIGKSKAKIYVEADTGVRFEDVAGVDEAKDELREIVDFLKNRSSMEDWADACRKACSSSAPPAPARRSSPRRSPARRRCRSSRSPAPSSWKCSWRRRGPGARSLRSGAREGARHHLHRRARCPRRARGLGGVVGGHDEKEQTLNQLLVELDGFDSRTGLVLLGATNRPEILDPALLRAGRFDRQVLVDRPDKKGRIRSCGCTCAR